MIGAPSIKSFAEVAEQAFIAAEPENLVVAR